MAIRKKTHKPNTPVATRNVSKQIISFEKDEDYRFGYSNIIQVLHTAYDFQLTFGLVDAGQRVVGPTAKVTAVATIAMTPQHAKKFAEVLNQNIARYEATVMALPFTLSDTHEAEIEIPLIADEDEDAPAS